MEVGKGRREKWETGGWRGSGNDRRGMGGKTRMEGREVEVKMRGYGRAWCWREGEREDEGRKGGRVRERMETGDRVKEKRRDTRKMEEGEARSGRRE